MGQLTSRTSPYDSYTNIQAETYEYNTYEKNGDMYTTNQLLAINDQTNEDNDRTSTYDANGNIVSVSYNGDTYAYSYDDVGRLIGEKKNNVTVAEYEYDGNNNLKKKTSDGVITEYTYDTINRLVDESEYVYDEMGNPTRYKGNTFAWEQGRKLVSGSMNGKNFAYAYDGNGMRYKKVVNEETTYYYYNGTQLLMESRDGNRTWYNYGMTGIEGMSMENPYQKAEYYFDKNTLGDIVAIRDGSGNIIARYGYDAWGNCTVMDGNGNENNNSSFIGNINPYRYRGYYYDVETGFYYLQTRYYDPSICRFINADNYELIASLSTVPGQLNLYAYCGNNPIMFTDETGEMLTVSAISAIFLAIYAVIFTINDIINLQNVSYEIQEGTVQIINSNAINTPWVQWGYSFYLNHINSSTKDIIKGTTSGTQLEWLSHNVIYKASLHLYIAKMTERNINFKQEIDKLIDATKIAGINATVFSNKESWARSGMIYFNLIGNFPATIIDYFIYGETK